MSDRRAPDPCENRFVARPLGRLFLSTAAPMAVVMSTGGLLTVVDGVFVGRFVGAQGLAAVGAAFPVVMLLNALSALVGGGMASLFSRRLGAGARDEAASVLAAAHGLALALALGLMVVAASVGPALVAPLAGGDEAVRSGMRDYLAILILAAPLQFGLGLHADALRSEGRAGTIALLSVLVNLVNAAANAAAIAGLGLGVAGSALGTAAAQALGLGLLPALRARDPGLLSWASLARAARGGGWRRGWGRILALGLPLSLNLAGMALAAAAVLAALGGAGTWTAAGAGAGSERAALVAGYGVATRLLGLAFLPLMAVALTVQSISGANAGAGRVDRAEAGLRLGMATAFLWCLGVTLLGAGSAEALGRLFSEDPQVTAAVGAILPPMTALYAVSGPILALAMHHQAMGRALHAAALILTRPWLLLPGLAFAIPALFGVERLWLAFPVADAAMLALALGIGLRRRRAARRRAPDPR